MNVSTSVNTSGLSKSQRRRRAKRQRISQAIQNQIGQQLLQQQQSTNSNNSITSKSARRRRRRQARARSELSRSPTYLDTIQNPEYYPGVKIPDLVMFPSSTFQLTYTASLIPASTGDTIAVLVQPLISDGSTYFPIRVYAGGTQGQIPNTATNNISWQTNTSLLATYQSYRPVSCCMTVEFTGNSTNDGGFLFGSLMARGDSLPTTIASALQLPDSKPVPVRNGLKQIWIPQDSSDFTYNVTGGSPVAVDFHQYPQIAIVASGLNTGSVLICEITANFEGIPAQDSWNLVNPTVSDSNPSQLREAMDWVYRNGMNTAYALYNTAGPYVQPLITNYARDRKSVV